MTQVASTRPKLDWTGMASAALCALHCLLTPVFLALVASFGWWSGLSYLFLAVSLYAAFETSRHHSGSPWLWLIWGSFALLAASILLEDEFPWLEIPGYLASAGLILGHLFNIRHCKKHPSHKQNQRTARERPV